MTDLGIHQVSNIEVTVQSFDGTASTKPFKIFRVQGYSCGDENNNFSLNLFMGDECEIMIADVLK